MSGAAEHRLPRTVIPARYELTLEPDLARSTFRGECTTEVEVVDETAEIVLNAAELDVEEAWIEGPKGKRVAAEIRLDPEAERAHLVLSEPLARGNWFVNTSFQGVLNDKLQGFYRSTFNADDGVEQVIATTQMEATHARRAFPCWDEPDLKAVFAVTLVVDQDHLAVANTRELRRVTREDGRVAVHFADSITMSTYLVAFVVGPLAVTEPVDVNGTELRVVHRPGLSHLTSFSLDTAAFVLRYLTDYYGIPYPGDKLDLVAIPDFAFGAMENMGCATFREVLLLVDPAEVTQPELQNVVDVVAHELAHMWFGNLVTMKWWNGIWLNEAFATFMEMKATDAFRPEWRRWVTFGISRSGAFDVDALRTTRPVEYEVVSPEDAEAMFDVLTYQKGAAVVRMLEQYVGGDRFRSGISDYLAKHQYANTETTDLWDSLEGATSEPTREIMDSWIFQEGFPVVHVEPTDDGVRLRQDRFVYSGDTGESRWLIPLVLRYGSNGSAVTQRLLLDDDLDLEIPTDTEWVHVNVGGHGFFRVRYAPALLGRLTKARELLDAAERYGLIDDAWASVLSGDTAASDFLELTRTFATEPDLSVWQRLIDCLDTLDRMVGGDAREVLRKRVRGMVTPRLDALGSEPDAAEDDRTRQLRGTLLRAAALLGHEGAAIHRGRRLGEAHLAGEETDPALTAAAISIIARTGDAEDFDTLLRQFREAETPQDELRYLNALADFDDRELMRRVLELTLTEDVRTQNAPYLLRRALTNPTQGPVAWDFVRQNWTALNTRFPSNSVVRMLEGVRSVSDPELAAEIAAFFDDRPIPQGERTLAQHLEKMAVNVALHGREGPRLAEVLVG